MGVSSIRPPPRRSVRRSNPAAPAAASRSGASGLIIRRAARGTGCRACPRAQSCERARKAARRLSVSGTPSLPLDPRLDHADGRGLPGPRPSVDVDGVRGRRRRRCRTMWVPLNLHAGVEAVLSRRCRCGPPRSSCPQRRLRSRRRRTRAISRSMAPRRCRHRGRPWSASPCGTGADDARADAARRRAGVDAGGLERAEEGDRRGLKARRRTPRSVWGSGAFAALVVAGGAR